MYLAMLLKPKSTDRNVHNPWRTQINQYQVQKEVYGKEIGSFM